MEVEDGKDTAMKMEITYTEKDGYLYPKLELPEQEEVEIGVFGQRHKRYLLEHRRFDYYELLTSGRMMSYLAEVYRCAREMFERIVNRTAAAHGVTEQMKADDPMAWVQEMNNIANMAEEIVGREVVYK